MSDKNYKSFKDYIEKRTVADIMSDYTEQKDEWEELPLAKTDKKSDADSKTKNTDAWWIQFYNFPLLLGSNRWDEISLFHSDKWITKTNPLGAIQGDLCG